MDNDIITLSDDHDYQTAISFLEAENIRSFKILIHAVQESELREPKEDEEVKINDSPIKNKEETSITKEQLSPVKEVLKEENSILIKEEVQHNHQEDVPVNIKEDVPILKEDVPIIQEEVPIIQNEEIIIKEEDLIVKEEKPIVKEEVSIVKEEIQIIKEEVQVLKEEVPIFQVEASIVKEDVQEEVPKEVIIEEVVSSNIEKVVESQQVEIKKVDPDDFSDLENIVQALKTKMDAEKDIIILQKDESHPIDKDMKTIAEELLGEKKQDVEPLPYGKPIYPPLNLDKEVQSSKEMKKEEEKQSQTDQKMNKEEDNKQIQTEKNDIKEKEKKDKLLENKLETIKTMKEFFNCFCEQEAVFQVPCYKCAKDKSNIFSFSCKKCNNVGYIRVDTHNPKYAVYNQIIKEKFLKSCDKFMAKVKNAKKRTSLEEEVIFLSNPYFCVSCRTFPIKGVNYVCDTCVNFAFCKQCHENQYHPHPMRKAYYEEDIKKKEKIFSLKNLGPELSPKGIKPYKASIIELPLSSIEVEPLKELVMKFTLKNNGSKNWPEKMKLECVQGCYKGLYEEVKSLKVGESSIIGLPLQAVNEPGKYEIKWKLAYDEEKERKYFGPKISFELVVVSKVVKKNPGIAWQDKDNLPKGNQEIIQKAEKMKEMLGGDSKKYIEFIRNQKMDKKPIDEIMDLWFQQN